MESIENKNFEPPMFLQRPSLSRSQDVSHILASVFRDLTRGSIGEQTVKNLTVSRSGEEGYHEKYVERLANIQSERQQQLDELAMLETHIMQARAAATAAEEQELRLVSEECDNYEALGLPPVKSHLRYCMDIALLKKYHLITPDDYVPTQYQPTKAPQGSPVPSYARPTTTSLQHFYREHVPDNYMETSVETHTYPFNPESVEPTKNLYSQVSPPKTARSKVSSSWRDSIKPDQRHKERSDLKRLNAKAEYLRNPRNALPSCPTLLKTHKNVSQNISTKDVPDASASTFKSSDILIPSPSPVIFKEYEVGEVYEMKLELKNVSSSMRQIRVLPPETKFFSIGLGQYPGEHGMIAPGMSCQFAIKFAPDSLTDYEDKIQIRTQLDDSLDILILGKRKPPELTLLTVLDSGCCLVGGTKTVSLNCVNNGGPGKFCIVDGSDWPTTSWKWTFDNPGYLALGPFCLQPAMFQLLEGQEISLQLTFQPLSAKYYKHEIVMVCDNCQVKQFTIQGVGQTARVEFVSVDGGHSQPVIGECCDTSAEYLVRFPDQNPCTMVEKKLVVKNMSNVTLPFNWQIMRPCMRSCDTRSLNDKNKKSEPSLDKDSVFKIYPDTGVLQPASSFDFKIESSPIKIGNFHSVAHLVLEKVPVLCCEDNLEQIEKDVVSMMTELKVSSKPFQIMVSPTAMVIPRKLLVQKLYKYHFKMINNSISEARYEWQVFEDDEMTIEPRSGTLDICEEQTLELNVYGQKAGLFNSTIHCQVEHSSEPVYLHIRTEFKGPDVMVDNLDLDFGLVRFGDITVQNISLTNFSEVPASWSLQEPSYYHLLDIHQDCKEMPSEFQFIPQSGKLEPFGETTVNVILVPLTSRRVRSEIECKVANSPSSYVQLTAEVQNPEICILSSNLVMEEVYVNVPLLKQIEMENKTLLETTFRWMECLGDDSEHCKVLFEPSEGMLGPRERKMVAVSFTGYKQGSLKDLAAFCDVEGMDESVYLSFEGTVHGLQVSFRTQAAQGDELSTFSAEDQNNLTLDFGKTFIGETPKTLLILKNETAIKTTYSIEVEHFHSGRVPTPPLDGAPHRKTRGQGVLAKSPNIADPLSKTPSKANADYRRALLRDGRGAAFVCTPSFGELMPFQERVIQVAAYSDMWGEYKDSLICKIDGLDPKYIPITYHVEGCPLNFQMTKDKSPMVRFGSHVSGGLPVERVLRVNNTSPCDIRVDWEVYNEEPDDSQLIDLIVDVGNPFPKMMNEKEVECNESSDRPLITVDVRKHAGKRADMPFSVYPPQQIVHSRKHSEIRVKFDPYSTTMTDVLCSSFALGFINLDNPNEIGNEHVKRFTGRDNNPFRLNMTGGIKPATLFIDVGDEEGTQFKTCASDLLKLTGDDSFETIEEVCKISYYTLCNTTQGSVNFSLFIDKPFRIMDINAPPSACSDSKKASKGRKITLKPRKNIQIEVGFGLSYNMLSMPENQDITLSSENDVLPTLKIHKDLQILYSNETSQTLPLSASVSLPHVLLSKEKIDFGVCLIGQSKEMAVKLTNFGKSSSCWIVEKDSRYPEESRQMFNIEPSSGFLEGHTSLASQNSVLLKLSFTARHSVSYESVLVFKGLLQEQPRYLMLSGQGSYDGGHEEVVSSAI